MNNDDTFTEHRHREGSNEDGDMVIRVEVRAKGKAGVKDFTNYRSRTGLVWTGCGNGWLRATYSYTVDGIELAIEARNDAWASAQQEIEDHALFRY